MTKPAPEYEEQNCSTKADLEGSNIVVFKPSRCLTNEPVVQRQNAGQESMAP